MKDKITAKIVPDDKRLDFLPKYFGKMHLKAESYIYDLMGAQCKDYTGGYWEFYETSNGAFYMAPDDETMHIVVETNGYVGDMSGNAAGLVMTIVCVNDLCWAAHANGDIETSEKMADYYYLLKDFACDHPEYQKILGAID